MLVATLAGLTGLACRSTPTRAIQDSRTALGDPDAGYRDGFYGKRTGLVLGARYHGTRTTGDLDGHTTLVGPDVIELPDVDDGTGAEVWIGQMDDGDQYIFSYGRFDLDGSIMGTEADVDFRTFALEYQHNLRCNEPLQPYFMLGLVFPTAHLENASTDGVNFGSARLRNGIGLKGGTGLTWWLAHGLALDLRAEYGYYSFSEAEGVASDAETVDDRVNFSNFGLSLGISGVLGGS